LIGVTLISSLRLLFYHPPAFRLRFAADARPLLPLIFDGAATIIDGALAKEEIRRRAITLLLRGDIVCNTITRNIT